MLLSSIFYHRQPIPTFAIPAQMADWSVVFAETLEEYRLLYVDARWDLAERVGVLKRCRNAIIQSPAVEKDAIQLPSSLRLVSGCQHSQCAPCPYIYLV